MKQFLVLAVSASVLFGACSKDQLKTPAPSAISTNNKTNSDFLTFTQQTLDEVKNALPTVNQALEPAIAEMEEKSNSMFGNIYDDNFEYSLVSSTIIYDVPVSADGEVTPANLGNWLTKVSTDAVNLITAGKNELYAIDFRNDEVSIEGNLAKVPVVYYQFTEQPQATSAGADPLANGAADYCKAAKLLTIKFNTDHSTPKPKGSYYWNSVNAVLVEGNKTIHEPGNGCGRHYLYVNSCYGHGPQSNYLTPLTASQLNYLYNGSVDSTPYGGLLNCEINNRPTNGPSYTEKRATVDCRLISYNGLWSAWHNATFHYGSWKPIRYKRIPIYKVIV